MNDPLFGNKFAAAILTALLIFFGLPQLANALIGGGHHGDDVHLAYPIEYKTETAAVEAAPKLSLGTLLASASAAGGERRAALCKSCHTFDKGGAQGTGPNLWNIVDRPIGGVDGFSYSGALQEAEGVWSYERLDAYLTNSQSYMPGTAMVQRFPKEAQRADILAYLQTLSDSPVPFPEPAEATEAAAADVEAAAEVAH